MEPPKEATPPGAPGAEKTPEKPTPPPNSNPNPAPQNSNPTPPAGEPELPENVKAQLAELAGLRTERDTLKGELQKIEDAKKTDLERAQDEAKRARDEAEAAKIAFKAQVTAYEVRLAARDAGVVDPADALALIDRSRIEYDAQGQPTNVKSLVADLVKAKPYLTAGKTQSQQIPRTPSPARPEPGSDVERHTAAMRASGAYAF